MASGLPFFTSSSSMVTCALESIVGSVQRLGECGSLAEPALQGWRATRGHACKGSLTCRATTDNWLHAYIAPYIANPTFAANHDLLIIAWDEGNLLDPSCSKPTTILMPPGVQKAGAWACGGHTVFLVIGADVKPGHVSTTVYHDAALLRL